MKKRLIFLMAALIAISASFAQKNVKSDFQTEKPAINTGSDNGLQHNKDADLRGLDNNSGSRAVTTFPWLESFTNSTFPPQDWVVYNLVDAYNSFVRQTSNAYSSPACINHPNTYYSSCNDWLVTPQIQLPASGAFELRFWTRFDGYGANNYVKISNGSGNPNSNPTDFVEVKTWSYEELSANFNIWTEVVIPLSGYLGQQIYIAFQYQTYGSSHNWSLDDIKIAELLANDLVASSISGNSATPAGQPASYTVNVKNNGSATQSTYNVHLKLEDGTLIQTLPGVSIASGETKQFVLAWTPSTEGTFNIYGEVELTGDEDSSNDKTSNYSVFVYNPNITLPYSMGFENSEVWQTWTIVKGSNGRDWGRISSTSYEGSYCMANSPVQSYTAANDWLFSPSIPLVGTKTYKISFWVRGNATYYTEKLELHLATGATPSDVVTTQPIWFNSNITHANYIKYESTITGYNGNHNLAFHAYSDQGYGQILLDNFLVEEMNSVTGTVTDGTNPVEGAAVQITGNPTIVYTDNLGNYTYSISQLTQFEFKVSKIGYVDLIQDVNVTADGQVVNFTLTPIATKTVSGKVTGNDTNNAGIQDVHITLSGYTGYQTDTDANGDYSISGVYDGYTYTLMATKSGYSTFTDQVVINGANETKNIELIEIANPASNVSVAPVNEQNPDAVVTWNAPYSGKGADRAFTGYHLYRLKQGAAQTEWTQILTNSTLLTYTDVNVWNTLQHGTYQYAVIAVYSSGTESTSMMSNYMDIKMTTQFTVNVTKNDGQPAEGVSVNLMNQNGNYLYNYYLTTGETGIVTFDNVYRGIYNLNVNLTGYTSYYISGLDITEDDTPAHDAIIIEPMQNVPNTVKAMPNETLTQVKVTWESPFSKAFTGYSVYKQIAGDQEWEKVADNITDLYYIEPDTDLKNGNIYQWAVKTVYSGGYESMAVVSNKIHWGSISNVSFELSTNGNDPVNGAIVKLTNQNNDPEFVYHQIINDSYVVFYGVYQGTYTLNIGLEGYQSYTSTETIDENFVTLSPIVLNEIIDEPFNLVVEEVEACEHLLSWNNVFGVDVTMTVYDVFEGFNLGFQMWLDDTAELYGTPSLPSYGFYSSCSLVNPSLFDEYSHSIPADASFSCSTSPASNWVFANNSATIQVPPGIYDLGIVYLYNNYLNSANAYGTCQGIRNDYEFKEGFKYTFTSDATGSWSNNFCVTEAPVAKSRNSKSFVGYNVFLDGAFIEMTTDTEYTFTNIPAGTHTAGVQAVYTSGTSAIIPISIVSTCTDFPTYTISATSNNTVWGSVTGSDDYDQYELVTLTATPEEGCEFLNWKEGEDVVSTSNIYEFAAIANRTIIGNFRIIPQYYLISAVSNNDEWGTVAGTDTYEENTTVTLNATPNAGYEFVNWTKEGIEVETENPYIFQATENCTIVGNFKESTQYFTITATSNDDAMGSVTGSDTYPINATVTLTATPKPGHEFVNWTEGETVLGTETTLTFPATADRTIKGNFRVIPPSYTITALSNDDTMGTVTGGDIYEENTTVTLTAIANTGHEFVNWTEGENVLGTATILTFPATADRTIKGNFRVIPQTVTYTITTSVNHTYFGSVTGGGTYEENAQVTLTATPKYRYEFENWEENDNVISTTNPLTFSAGANRSIKANFKRSAITEPIYFEDNFDDYTAGQLLCVQNNTDWTTWSNKPGQDEDALISNAQSTSFPNSLNITKADDIIYRFVNQTTGHYQIEMDMFIPTGSGGAYFNVQHYYQPGEQWAFECEIKGTGAGTLLAGNTENNFNAPVNSWFLVKIDINLNGDQCSLYVNEVFIRTWPFKYQSDNTTGGINQLGSINFYGLGANSNGNYFVDNFLVLELVPPTPGIFVINPDSDIYVEVKTTATKVVNLSNQGGSSIDYNVVAVYDIPNPNSTSTGQQQITYVNGTEREKVSSPNTSRFVIATGYAPSSISNHIGKTIRRFNFGLSNVAFVTSAKLCIWEMGVFGKPSSDEPIYQQNIPLASLKDGSENFVTLTTPRLIDGSYIFIGLDITLVGTDNPDETVNLLIDRTPLAQCNPLARLYKGDVAWNYLGSEIFGQWDMAIVVDGTPVMPWMNLNHTSANLQPNTNKDLTITFGASDITTNCVKEAQLHFYSTDFFNEETILNVVATFEGSGISKESIQPLTVFVKDGILHVIGLTPGEKWSINNISGVCVYESVATNVEEQLRTKALSTANGIFIIKSGNKTAKIVF